MAHTVLIADDSRTIRQIVGMALKAQPYQIVEAGSARQAMEALQRSPDIVLLDYYMPDGSGYEICRAIKSNAATRSIPVVMLGGTYQNFDESMARQAGADDVIWKPFKTDELVAAIVRAVGMIGAGAPAQAAPSRPAPPPNPFAGGRPQPPAPQQAAPQPPAPQPPAPQQAYQRPAATTTSGSQPRIPSQAPQGSRPAPSSSPDINASAIKPQPAPVQPSSPGVPPAAPGGLDREALSEMITEEVRATVRKELPGLLRNVMGELLQQKIMPRLMQHVDERVNASFGQLDERIQAQVRSELETLLEDL